MRRIGKFSLSNGLLFDRDSEAALRNILDGMLVVRAEPDFLTDRTNYVGLHEQFDLLPLDAVIPEYVAEFDAVTGEVRWRRVDQPAEQSGLSMLWAAGRAAEQRMAEAHKNAVMSALADAMPVAERGICATPLLED